MILNKELYNKVFTWENLISNGYLDFREYNDFNRDNIISLDDIYGHTDVIYSDYFNMSKIIPIAKKFIYFTQIKKKKRHINICNTSPILFTIPKNDNNRRPLKFPNLYSYCLLVSALIKNKERLMYDLSNDKESTSRFFDQSPYKYQISKSIENKLLIGHKYYYKTDFSSFYHSFYTHTIAWFINGKTNAKKYRTDINKGEYDLGNYLDHIIRSQQDGETHGVPTGNLATRIVIEECMSYFDDQLRKLLRSNNTYIAFQRYVDDIIFGYDRPNDLDFIKKTLTKITQKYEIIINDKKTTSITFNEIAQQSDLKNYFVDVLEKSRTTRKLHSLLASPLDNSEDKKFLKLLELTNKPTIKFLVSKFNDFYIKLNNEILSNIKGAGKLGLRSLTFLIKNLSDDEETLNRIFKAFIKIDDRIDSNVQSTFIDKILQLTFSDSRLMLPFIQLIDVIQQADKKHLVVDYLQQNLELRRLQQQIKFYLRNNFHQEAYALFLLCNKLNLNITKNLFPFIEALVDNDNVIIDDFNMIFLIDQFVKNISSFNLRDQIKFLSTINKLLKPTSNSSKLFADNHWLIRYYVIYEDKQGGSFHKCIKKIYKMNPFTCYTMKYKLFMRQYKQLRLHNTNSKKIYPQFYVNKFFKKLLDCNIKLIDIS